MEGVRAVRIFCGIVAVLWVFFAFFHVYRATDSEQPFSLRPPLTHAQKQCEALICDNRLWITAVTQTSVTEAQETLQSIFFRLAQCPNNSAIVYLEARTGDGILPIFSARDVERLLWYQSSGPIVNPLFATRFLNWRDIPEYLKQSPAPDFRDGRQHGSQTVDLMSYVQHPEYASLRQQAERALIQLVGLTLPVAKFIVVPYLFPAHASQRARMSHEIAVLIASSHFFLVSLAHERGVHSLEMVGVTAGMRAPCGDLLLSQLRAHVVNTSISLIPSSQKPGCSALELHQAAPSVWRLRLKMDVMQPEYQGVVHNHAVDAIRMPSNDNSAETARNLLIILYCASSLHCMLPIERSRSEEILKFRVASLIHVSALATKPSTSLMSSCSGTSVQTNGVGPINASSAVMRLGDERTDRTAKFSPVLTYRDLEFGRKSMVFLIQGADPSSVRAAVDAHMRVRGATVVVLCWKLPCDELRSEYRDVHVLFGANSTWTQGRNALFWYALQLEATENEGPFEFVTLLDEDAILHCSQTTESCVQQFAEYARKKKAAVVVPAYFRSCWYNDTENIVRDFDALYNTFHRLAVGLLLPYHENYDSISWHRSQQIVIHQSSCFLGHVYEFAGVRVQNMLHREYPKGSVCTRESVTQDIVPSSIHPLVSWTCKECIPRETLSRIVNSTRTKHNDELRWVESICNATALLSL